MSWPFLIEPNPLYIAVIMLLVYFGRNVQYRRWPDMEKCVEIIAYSGGMIAASLMLTHAFSIYGEVPTNAWALFTGAVVTGLASVRGAWSVLTGIKPKVQAKQRESVEDHRPEVEL